MWWQQVLSSGKWRSSAPRSGKSCLDRVHQSTRARRSATTFSWSNEIFPFVLKRFARLFSGCCSVCRTQKTRYPESGQSGACVWHSLSQIGRAFLWADSCACFVADTLMFLLYSVLVCLKDRAYASCARLVYSWFIFNYPSGALCPPPLSVSVFPCYQKCARLFHVAGAPNILGVRVCVWSSQKCDLPGLCCCSLLMSQNCEMVFA